MKQTCLAHHYTTGQPMEFAWDNGELVESRPASSAPEGLWLAPALVDLQINGYGGVDFQGDALTHASLLEATRRLRKDGCGRYLLTLITARWECMLERLRHVRSLRQQSNELRHAIVGWHIEGPFLSEKPGFCGAHAPAFMLDPTRRHLLELREAAGTDPILLTLAPERPRALAAIGEAVALGMRVSLGHTDAPSEVLREAVRHGAGAFTHLGNGCPRQLDRHDNILWRVFDTPGLVVSLIPDRIHVSPELFRLAHRQLPRENIYYTTDAMSAAGMPAGRYQLGQLELEVGSDQVVRLPRSQNFAGSALRPIEGVFRAAEMLHTDWRDVWERASTRPARLMNLPGGLEPGTVAPACLLRIDGAGKLTELSMIGLPE
jgi:N-acetylglucosamine-6-phosphate deacetylase